MSATDPRGCSPPTDEQRRSPCRLSPWRRRRWRWGVEGGTDVPESLPGPTTTTTGPSPPAPAEPQDPELRRRHRRQRHPQPAAGCRRRTGVGDQGLPAGPPWPRSSTGVACGSGRHVDDPVLQRQPADRRVRGLSTSRSPGDGGGPVRLARCHRVRRHPLQRPRDVLEDGTVDMVVDTFTINCVRDDRIDFSSQYFESSQKLLVRRRRGDGHRRPRRPPGLRRRAPPAPRTCGPSARARVIVEEEPDQADCLVLLQQGQVDGISTDDTILAGMAAQDPNVKIVGEPFADEPYGIGVAPGPSRVRTVRERCPRAGAFVRPVDHVVQPVPVEVARLRPTAPGRVRGLTGPGSGDRHDRPPRPGLEKRPHRTGQPAGRPRVRRPTWVSRAPGS